MLLLCELFTNLLFQDYHCLMFSITQRPSTLRVDNMDLPRQRKDLIFYPQILHYVMRSDTIMSRKNDNYQRLLRVRKKHRKYCGKLLTSKQTFLPSIHFNMYTPGDCFKLVDLALSQNSNKKFLFGWSKYFCSNMVWSLFPPPITKVEKKSFHCLFMWLWPLVFLVNWTNLDSRLKSVLELWLDAI